MNLFKCLLSIGLILMSVFSNARATESDIFIEIEYVFNFSSITPSDKRQQLNFGYDVSSVICHQPIRIPIRSRSVKKLYPKLEKDLGKAAPFTVEIVRTKLKNEKVDGVKKLTSNICRLPEDQFLEMAKNSNLVLDSIYLARKYAFEVLGTGAIIEGFIVYVNEQEDCRVGQFDSDLAECSAKYK